MRIGGEIFDPVGGQPEMIGAISTLSAVDPGLAPDEYLVQVKPGTDIGSYVNALSSALGKATWSAPTTAAARCSRPSKAWSAR